MLLPLDFFLRKKDKKQKENTELFFFLNFAIMKCQTLLEVCGATN